MYKLTTTDWKILIIFIVTCYVLDSLDPRQKHERNATDYDLVNHYVNQSEENKTTEGTEDASIGYNNNCVHSVAKRSFRRSYRVKRNLTPGKAINGTQAPSFEDKHTSEMYGRNACKAKNCGRPLMVTPLLEAGKVAEALAMAKVPKNSISSSVKSYSGIFTINATESTNMFFWFFPAMEDVYAPIVVRLEGGPGQSALFDIFNGIGPFRLDQKLNVQQNPNTLARTANLLYFDNPVGTGFSYTDAKDHPTTQEAVAEHIYSAINQFLKLFPTHKDNYIYISGEGYGAKYALSLARKIYELKDKTPVNLKGIILGSPFLDPEVIFNSHHYLFEVGILDETENDVVYRHLKEAQSKTARKNFSEAMDMVEEVYGSPYRIPVNKKYYIPSLTGISSQYHILKLQDPPHYGRYIRFVNQTKIRQALHVGNLPFQDGRKAYDALRHDILQSSRNDLATAIDQYHILIYNGNFDKKTPASLTSEILERVNWKHLEEFKRNERMLWKLEADDNINTLVGYIRKVRRLVHALVLNSGHLVASDQPEVAYDAINRFIWGRAYETIRY